jgi:hypothetical protein
MYRREMRPLRHNRSYPSYDAVNVTPSGRRPTRTTRIDPVPALG